LGLQPRHALSGLLAVGDRKGQWHGASLAAGTDREPEPWETNAAGPFLSIREVGVFALGDDHFRITWPGGEREVEGFEQARGLAHGLAS
jgi:hypothetical protein